MMTRALFRVMAAALVFVMVWAASLALAAEVAR
jgi:hypothetical protein